ncbi:hypothetical protein Y032_0008g202 [Ancylostoma ceylanicum]|uniref:Uncharacterized protein n=1 Tax=Ancylostoma ceylanicum TaxID=53326 RepID=A0A016VKJ7_9BILA|nr:hypothetical protein Y032_0008g202 [Ancylostoma ceylanicum]
MLGYRAPGGKGAPAPSTAKNTEIRDQQWRRAVLAGSSVKNEKDLGPPMEKGESALSIVGNRRASYGFTIFNKKMWKHLDPGSVLPPWIAAYHSQCDSLRPVLTVFLN